jgi:chromosomal replication initiator protein
MTLEAFVVGPCNHLAHSAASFIVGGEDSYSPLFVHGGTGLGKTHLFQGICHAISRKDPGLKVLYINCDTFITEVCRAMSSSRVDRLRERYAELDVLAMDDVHLLSQKAGSQKMFLRIYNDLDSRHKQILLAANAHPKLMEGIQEELRSRFISGVIAPLTEPNYPTRLKILKKCLGRRSDGVPAEALELAARSLKGSIRELVGVAKRLAAEARCSSAPVTAERVSEILADSMTGTVKPVTVADIEAMVSQKFAVPIDQLKSRRQSRSIALPRHIAMFLSRDILGLSYQEIGAHFGGKNHATVISAEQKVRKLMDTDPDTRTLVNCLREMIRPRP